MTKHCSKCGAEKPISEFYIVRKTGNPRQPCKKCSNLASKVQYYADPKEHNERVRIYRENNKESLKAYTQRYKQSGRAAEVRIRWRAANRTKTKEYWLRQKYGITFEGYEAIFSGQDRRCALCRKEKPLCIDHDHITGEVRGLLCKSCNVALGLLGDDEAGLLAALNYLRGDAKCN